MNSINIPRYYNGNLVYDEIPMNSIITTSTSGYNYINSNNDGILVKNNNDISFKKFNGILYYKNNELTNCELSPNNLLCTDGAGTLSQIIIGGGVLNTYKFDDNSVDTSNADPSFTNKIVLNDCEIVDDSNQRINKNYLIYGNGIEHGLSPIELDSQSYEYYYIVNDSNKVINVSTTSQIYTDLYNTVVNQESIQVPTISAIPICKSNETNQQLALIIPKMFDNGDYYININSDNTEFSLKNISGSILPSSLHSDDIKDFDYRKYNIYTATSNKNEFTLLKSSSTQFNEPYLSGNGWKDLTTTTFLNSNNLSITESLIYSNPVVIGTNGSMYGVVLPDNKKYILTKSSLKELQITGSDISINNTTKINLKNIIQINNDSKLYKLEDTTLSSGILHTTIDGDIVISLLTNNDIEDNTISGEKITFQTLSGSKIINNTITGDKIFNNTITGDKIAGNTITGNNIQEKTITGNNIQEKTITGDKLLFNDNSQPLWSNIIIDQNNKLCKKYINAFTDNQYGVFDYNGNIQSLCANIITEGTMNGDRISKETLQYNRLKISTDPQTSNWSIIEVNSNDNFIKFSNTLSLNNQYGVFDYNGNIVQLTTDKISGTITSNMIANGSIGSIKLGTSSVTTVKIDNNAVTGDKIAPGAVGITQIANNSITSSKLNINDSNLSGTWKNLLIDNNNNNFVTTGASVTHYGVFNNIGGVQEFNAAVLNEIGFNLYIPDDENNEFNQTFVSANCRFYTNDIIYKYVNTNYIKVYNYFNSNNSSNKIIYVNNSNQITDSYGNISNTYTLFSKINDKNNNKYNIKLKVSLNIKDVQIDLTNTNNSNFSYINLDNTLLKSGTILIVGVYTSLCKLNDPSQVLVLPNKIFRYTDNTNYCKSTLLGYLPILVNTIENEKINNINIDKIFDFECIVDKNNFFLDDFENIKNNLLFFVPMFYINIYDNTNSIIGLNYADYVVKDIYNNNKNVSTFYTNMCLNNDNSFTITYTKSNDSNTKTIISSSDISVNNDEITIKNYNNYNINFTDNNIFYVGTDSNDKNFMHLQNMERPKIVTIDSFNHKMTFKYFLNEPIEKNIKINLSPITNQSNIIYTTKDTGTNELKNTITYKFSLCSINLSLTKNTGEYPTQFKMS